jgi:hypothetical protein
LYTLLNFCQGYLMLRVDSINKNSRFVSVAFLTVFGYCIIVQGGHVVERNQALKKALACLSHPLVIGAVLLLAINDHLLRHYWPSWLTGKLGDFAWLFFFPFITATVLAWLLPRRFHVRSQWVGGLAFGLVGAVFFLMKTLPGFREDILRILEKVFRFPITISGDVTDLVALLSLVPAAWLWKKSRAVSAKRLQPGLVWLAAGMLLTMANMPQPDPGIYCLGQVGEEIAACASYGCYTSTNGGLSWKVSEDIQLSNCPDISSSNNTAPEAVSVPAQSGVTYSFTPGGDIRRSEGVDTAGQVEYQVKPVTQAQKAYYFKTHTGNPILVDSPQEGMFDPASGNVVFTLGHEGVLVRQPDGSYRTVQVGPYGQVKTTQWDVLITLLSGELGLAACFGGLVVVVLGLYEERSLLKKLVSVLAVVAWLFPVFFVPPALSASSYAAMLSSISILVAGLLIFPLALDGFFMVGILAPDSLLKLGLLVIAGMCLFFLPYLLWGINLLPDYRLATFAAVILGGGFMLIQYRALLSGTLYLKPEISSEIEPKRVKRAGWLFLAGALLAIVGIGLVVFGLNIGFAGVLFGLILMIGGAWIRRRVWMTAKKEEPEQQDPENQ